MNNFFILIILRFCLRLSIFFFAYLLYLIQLILIFVRLNTTAKKIFNFAAFFCAMSLGFNYEIKKNEKLKLFKLGIHIANHDNPLDIFVVQNLFGLKTITTINQHLNNFLPFFKFSVENFGHYCFDYKNFNQRVSAYLFLNTICSKYKKVLIYPSGSIYTSITKRFSKSVSKLSMLHNLEVIAWKFSFNNMSNNIYENDILKYIFQRFMSDTTYLKVEKVKIFNPNEYQNKEEFMLALRDFYSNM